MQKMKIQIFILNNPTNELIVNNKSNSYKHMITTLDYRVKQNK